MSIRDSHFFRVLVRYYGLITKYQNLDGKVISVPDSTTMRLLESLGVDCRDVDALKESLEKLKLSICERDEEMIFSPYSHNQIKVCFYHTSPKPDIKPVLTGEAGDLNFPMQEITLEMIRTVNVLGKTFYRFSLTFRADLDLGYYRLSLCPSRKFYLIVYPDKAFLPKDFHKKKDYRGIAVQLYSLRNSINLGIGDFSSLREIHELADEFEFVSINPICANSLVEGDYHSPYLPITRKFFDPVYINVQFLKDLLGVPDDLWKEMEKKCSVWEVGKGLNDLEFVDYGAVKRLKKAVLFELFEFFIQKKQDDLVCEFEDFCCRGGEDLTFYALFESLASHFGTAYFHHWPSDYRWIHSPALTQWLEEKPKEILFYKFLQFLVECQMEKLSGSSKKLMFDMPVGVSRGGLDVWMNPGEFLHDFSVGAPPDYYNAQGQNWGFPPFNPSTLRNYLSSLRTQMKYADMLRIDHILGIRRLFVIPQGSQSSEGIYLRYPEQKLRSLILLESVLNSCVIIGEDLGLVTDGFSDWLNSGNIFSTKVLFFQKDENGNYFHSERYPKMSLAMPSTHDSPTLWSYFSFSDLRLFLELGILKSQDEMNYLVEERKKDIQGLLKVVGIFERIDNIDEKIHGKILEFIFSTNSTFKLIPLEELTHQKTPVNIPGCPLDKYPSFAVREKSNLQT